MDIDGLDLLHLKTSQKTLSLYLYEYAMNKHCYLMGFFNKI